jgi:DNA repair exonuclease SbcCD ATPase subunit
MRRKVFIIFSLFFLFLAFSLFFFFYLGKRNVARGGNSGLEALEKVNGILAQIDIIEKDVAKIEDTKKKVGDLKNLAKAIESKEANQITGEVQQLKKLIQELTDLDKVNQDLLSLENVAENIGELENAKRFLSDLKNEYQKILDKKIDKEITDLTNKLDRIKNLSDQTLTDLENAIKDLKNFDEKIKKTWGSIENFSKELENLDTEIGNTVQTLNQNIQQIKVKLDEIKNIPDEITRLNQEIESINRDAQDLINKIDQVISEIKNNKKPTPEEIQEIKRLIGEITRLLNDANSILNEINSVQQKINEINNLIQNITQQINDVQNKLEKIRNFYKSLGDVETLKKLLEIDVPAISDLIKALGDLQALKNEIDDIDNFLNKDLKNFLGEKDLLIGLQKLQLYIQLLKQTVGDIEAYKAKIENLSGKLKDLKETTEDIADLQALVNDPQNQQKLIAAGMSQQEIQQLKDKINKIAEIKAKIEEIEKIVTTIEFLKNKIGDVSYLITLINQIPQFEEINGTIQELQTKYNEVQKLKTLAEDLKEISDLLGNIKDLNDLIANLDKIEKKLDEIEGILNKYPELKSLAEGIGKLKKLIGDLNDLKQQLYDLCYKELANLAPDILEKLNGNKELKNLWDAYDSAINVGKDIENIKIDNLQDFIKSADDFKQLGQDIKDFGETLEKIDGLEGVGKVLGNFGEQLSELGEKLDKISSLGDLTLKLCEEGGNKCGGGLKMGKFVLYRDYKCDKGNEKCGKDEVWQRNCVLRAELTCCPPKTRACYEFDPDENGEKIATCENWEICVPEEHKLRCDDNGCHVDGFPPTNLLTNWVTGWARGVGSVFGGKFICSCYGKCLKPIEPDKIHFYDGSEDFDKYGEIPQDCSKLSGWKKEECEEIKNEGMKLPIRIGWEVSGLEGWNDKKNDSRDPQSFLVKLDGFERLLPERELLNKKSYWTGEEIKYDKLQQAIKNEDKNKLKSWLNQLAGSPDPKFLDKAFEDNQRLSQLLYSIHFRDYPYRDAGNRNLEGGSGGTLVYSPSQDKKRGPCSLVSGKTYNLKVKLCCGEDPDNCGPPGTKGKEFKTHPGPEPVGILETKVLKWDQQEFIATSTRWVDTDWNGPGFVDLKEGDYYDPQWCLTPGQDFYRLRAFYEGRVEIGKEKTQPEEAFQKCVDPNAPCYCREKKDPCLCEYLSNYDYENSCNKVLDKVDVAHPAFRIPQGKNLSYWNLDKNKLDDQLRWEVNKEMESSSEGIIRRETYFPTLAEKEENKIEEDVFSGASLANKIASFGWDFTDKIFLFGLNQKWQGGVIKGAKNITEAEIKRAIFGQKWGFKISKPPPQKIDLTKVDPWKDVDYFENTLFVNRIQELTFSPINRHLSWRIKIIDNGKEIPLPKNTSILKKEPVLKNFKVWPCLKKDNGKRLGEEFTLKVIPCSDEQIGRTEKEREEHCYESLGYETKIKVTGDPISFEGNTSSTFDFGNLIVPTTIEWDEMPGAASYYYKITGPEEKEGIVTNSFLNLDLKKDGKYEIEIKTCADQCDQKDKIECGTSTIIKFFGCNTEFDLKASTTQILPGETIEFSWTTSTCGTSTVYYQKKLELEEKFECDSYIGEARDKCEKVNNSTSCQEFLKSGEPPTTTTSNSATSSPPCLGIYKFSVSACLDEECFLRGMEKSVKFSVVLEKMPTGGGGGLKGGFFKRCTNILPCQDCTFKDIPALISNIINCILWTLFPMAFIPLFVYTGIVFYLSFGSPEAPRKIKSAWKAYLFGALVMFLGWTLLNLIYTFLGYKKNFGDWWNPILPNF